MAIIDSDSVILGRMASMVAKRLLSGEEIVIVNAEKAIISGSRRNVEEEYHQSYQTGSVRKGPHYPKRADRIVKRVIRGMLPKTSRGREALKRLRVHIGVPDSLKKQKIESLDSIKKVPMKSVRLGDVSKSLGSKI